MGQEIKGYNRARLLRVIQESVTELAEGRKIKPVLVVDEANHLSGQVLAELHVITQYHQDSRPLLPVILCGQTALLERLSLRCALPLASRVIAKTHLDYISLNEMRDYLHHHLRLTGVSQGLFEEEAYLAIHQGSGGFYRKANHLARGALICAAAQKRQIVSPEHVRIAATELI